MREEQNFDTVHNSREWELRLDPDLSPACL